MAKKRSKKVVRHTSPKKCKQCGVNPCAELWAICDSCAKKNIEYEKQIDKNRCSSMTRWPEINILSGLPLRRPRGKNRNGETAG